MHKNLMIYGSSVSRDPFEDLGSDYALLAYIARQSMISALSRPTALLTEETLGSALQNRSLNGDLKSNLLPTLQRYAPEADLLVIDLTDERLGVIRLPDGNYVTRSPELMKSPLPAGIAGKARRIAPATEEHWTLWESAANRLFGSLTAMGLRDKTLVLNTPWARVTEHGEAVPPFRDSAQDVELNAYLAECCAHIRSLGYTVATLPPELRVSESSHKWGPSPYHFGSAARQWIAGQMASAAAGVAVA
ncbi:DUF6270 domain-containing protein [Arthrobacter cupressi]|uniref:GDSL-like Lipase/Acylhydrolase family protein n=1 Tax=Arthrobacter cupressi TaxID=1045773 RepID=A0A1G8UIX6_9MICC|nr:DUF6270 domain-containing protein [Arthrobacter cupressi]NYD76501.1 hypothetical protein [Arthrobacter cupressi]SDJ53709.1 hypothetical protein SAMN05216555_11215 [Arthrobacter cupressi]